MRSPQRAQIAPPVAAGQAAKTRRSLAPGPFDVLLVALLGVVLPIALGMGGAPSDRWVRVLVGLVVVAPLLWRSRAPVSVLAVEIGIAISIYPVLEVFSGPNPEYVWIPMLFALGAVAARRPVWASLLGLIASYAAMALSLVAAWPGVDIGWLLFSSALLCTVAWIIGVSAHAIRSRVKRLEAERQRSQADLLAQRQEIAAGVEAIIEQAVRRMRSRADAARRSISADATATTAALSAVEADGVDAMQELHRFVRRLDADRADEVRPEPAVQTIAARVWRRLLGIEIADLIIMLLAVVATTALTIILGGGLTIPAVVFIPTLILLLWRNQFPVLVFTLIAAAYAGVVLVFHGGDFVWDTWLPVVGLLVSLAAAAGSRPEWLSLPLALITCAYLSVPALLYPEVLVENMASFALLIAVVWTAGFFGGRRRRRVGQLQRDRDATARQTRREHAELAHNLHDLIGHSITIMVLQAAGARRILPQDPARAIAALDAIDSAGADALRELAQLVELLRATPESPAMRTPAPAGGLADIDDLVERTRAGVRAIEVRVRGNPSLISHDSDATAFAVVREALANAEKHAGEATQIAIVLEWGPDAVDITIANTYDTETSDTASELSGGYGLASLRERVREVDGELTWAANGREFSVTATFPTSTS